MAIDTYSGLQSAVSEWMARDGDTDLSTRFSDFLKLCEQKVYLGRVEIAGIAGRCEPLRIREMETVNTAFALSAATVAQPAGFLGLIEAKLNSPVRVLQVVEESVIDSYTSGSGVPGMIAISGTNFRVGPGDPGSSNTASLRYFQKFDTPTPSAGNWLLSNAPGVYLNGCLYEASVYDGDADAARLYANLFSAEVAALNERRRAELANAANVRVRIRGRTP